MKILLVAGGHLPIPPPAWGGVENVIWQQYNYLTKAGHQVTILNRKKKTVRGFLARPWQYDMVHLHIDSGAKGWGQLQRLFHFPLALTTHYGYAAFPSLWTERYRKIFHYMMKIPVHITLSPEIRDMIREAGFTGQAFVLPNGIECSDVRFDPEPAPKEALVLGRIQDRKKQRFLAEALKDRPITCDLIGPSEETDFTGNGKNVLFLGPWSRDQVTRDLTQYACMVLISDGEAHAGVLLEAMAAGLSLVVSPESSHNLDIDRPWLHVVDRDKPGEVADAIERAVAENPRYRQDIRRYCEATFDWSVIGPRYVRIIEEIVAASKGKAR